MNIFRSYNYINKNHDNIHEQEVGNKEITTKIYIFNITPIFHFVNRSIETFNYKDEE